MNEKKNVYKFTVYETPLSVNHYTGQNRGRTYVKPEALAFKAMVAQCAPLPYPVLVGDVFVRLDIVRKANRGDVDNFSKLCLDSLKGIAYEDDRQVKELHLSIRTVDKHNPSVTFTVMLLKDFDNPY